MLVIWIELTSCWEENLTKKHFEKMDKYNKLAIDLRETKHHRVEWTVVPLCVERKQHCTAATRLWLLDIKLNGYQSLYPNGTETTRNSQ